MELSKSKQWRTTKSDRISYMSPSVKDLVYSLVDIYNNDCPLLIWYLNFVRAITPAVCNVCHLWQTRSNLFTVTTATPTCVIYFVTPHVHVQRAPSTIHCRLYPLEVNVFLRQGYIALANETSQCLERTPWSTLRVYYCVLVGLFNARQQHDNDSGICSYVVLVFTEVSEELLMNVWPIRHLFIICFKNSYKQTSFWGK